MTEEPDPRIAAMETDMQAMQVALFDLLERVTSLQSQMNKLRRKARKAEV